MARIRGHIRYLDIIFSRLYRNRKELDFTESHYYRINQILLSTVQLWPYEKSMLTTVNRILLLTLLLSLVFFQVHSILLMYKRENYTTLSYKISKRIKHHCYLEFYNKKAISLTVSYIISLISILTVCHCILCINLIQDILLG